MQVEQNRKEDISFYVWLTAFCVCGLILRWINLDLRPIHHDESLHLHYAKRIFDFPTHNYYRYDPMLHGPLLYNVTALAYLFGGVSTWTGRGVTALIGSLLMFVPLLFRHMLSRRAVLVLTAALALSPTAIYWSRFIRADLFVLWGVLLIGLGSTKPSLSAGTRIVLVSLGIIFEATSKEDIYVHCALLLGFFIFEGIISSFVTREQSLFKRAALWSKAHSSHVLIGLLITAALYSLLFSAGFQYPKGILDGLYRESLSYWWESHNNERISGPFLYHIFFLSWYELPFMLFALFQLIHFYAGTARIHKLVAGVFIGITLLMVYLSTEVDFSSASWAVLLKVKSGADLAAFLLLIIHAPFITYIHLIRRERSLAFAGYLFFASLFTYSYLGEKVPWLSLYPHGAGLWYLALYTDTHLFTFFRNHLSHIPSSRVLFGAGGILMVCGVIFTLEEALASNWLFSAIGLSLVGFGLFDRFFSFFGSVSVIRGIVWTAMTWNLLHAVLVNHARAGNSSELISQVHTTQEFHDLARSIRQTLEDPLQKTRRVFISGDVVWPLTWYFRDLRGYQFSSKDEFRQGFDYVIKDYEPSERVPDGYTAKQVTLRGWWVPPYKEMTLKRFLGYALFHYPWNNEGVGYAYATLYVRE